MKLLQSPAVFPFPTFIVLNTKKLVVLDINSQMQETDPGWVLFIILSDRLLEMYLSKNDLCEFIVAKQNIVFKEKTF